MAQFIPNDLDEGIFYDSANDFDDSQFINNQYPLENESKRENDLQNSFNDLVNKFSVLRNKNLEILKDVKNLELENNKLLETLSDSPAVCNTLKYENHVLIVKVKSLGNDLNDCRNHLRKFSNNELDKLLHDQKHYGDRSGLRFI
jgi:hypothetical protein